MSVPRNIAGVGVGVGVGSDGARDATHTITMTMIDHFNMWFSHSLGLLFLLTLLLSGLAITGFSGYSLVRARHRHV